MATSVIQQLVNPSTGPAPSGRPDATCPKLCRTDCVKCPRLFCAYVASGQFMAQGNVAVIRERNARRRGLTFLRFGAGKE
jgi:hypothetical protein